MNSQVKIILSLIAKVISTIVGLGTLFGTVLLGSPLILIFNVPSLIIVVVLTGCGIVFSFGPIFPFKAFLSAFVVYEPFDKNDLNLAIKLFNHASYLSFTSGLIGTIICFIQIFTNTENWQLFGAKTVIAVLPFFYGIILSIIVFQSFKYSLINNYFRGIKR